VTVEFKAELVIPELYQLLLIAALFIQSIAGGSRIPRAVRWLPWLAGVGVVISLMSLHLSGVLFSGSYQVDRVSQFFKMTVSLGFAISVLNAVRQSTLDQDKETEYFLFMALSAWGLMLLSSAVELISIYLALEVASFSLFPLVPLRSEDKGAAEAGIKYIFFGAAATAIGLLGFSYILAGQHTSYLADLAQKPWAWSEAPMAVAGLTLFLCAILFKLALFPFHFWAPDVYQGAGNETAAYIATLPKVGAVVILIRFASLLKPGLEITTILAVLAALSITYGNLAALIQRDIKRLLGYSAIAHAGYVVIGLLPGTPEGTAAAAFYIFVYGLMNFACFWVVCRISGDGRNLMLEDLNGLHQRSPGLALVLAVGAVALVGLPPTAGFMGKLFLLTAAWDHGYNWLIVVAALNVAVSIYYYLNLVRHAYTNEAPDPAPTPISHPLFSVLWGGLLAGLVILFGLLPNLVFRFLLPL
jgi:proton-translocating NADH-quinone oxidoreductase chain N